MSKKSINKKNAPLISLSVTSIKNFIDIIFLHGTKTHFYFKMPTLWYSNPESIKVHKIEN